MNHEAWYLGIDLGGTAVKAGVVDERGSVLASCTFDTPYETAGQAAAEPDDVGSEPTSGAQMDEAARIRNDRYVAFMRELSEFVGEKLGEPSVAGIGIAVPGVVEGDLDLKLTPNIRIDLEAFVDAAVTVFGAVRTVVVNDANAAAIGESWIGVASGMRNVLLVTLGTGVGAGLVVNGALYTGAHGGAGEFGHLCVEPGGIPCNCGSAGCLEQYASGRGLVRMYREAGGTCPDNNAHVVLQAFENGDLAAIRAVDVFSEKLGFGLAQAASLLDPDVIVIGGGISQSARLFLNHVRRSYSAYALSTCCNTPIVAAELHNDAGFVGAARQVMCVMAREAAAARTERSFIEAPGEGASVRASGGAGAAEDAEGTEFAEGVDVATHAGHAAHAAGVESVEVANHAEHAEDFSDAETTGETEDAADEPAGAVDAEGAEGAEGAEHAEPVTETTDADDAINAADTAKIFANADAAEGNAADDAEGNAVGVEGDDDADDIEDDDEPDEAPRGRHAKITRA